jgi:hypothetical protein
MLAADSEPLNVVGWEKFSADVRMVIVSMLSTGKYT